MNSMSYAVKTQLLADSDLVAPDCNGLNFWEIDDSIRPLLKLYVDDTAYQHFEPELNTLGKLCGEKIDGLSGLANQHAPVLHHRDRFGRNQHWVEVHPAYKEMEAIAYGQFGMHAMSRRKDVLGWPDIVPSAIKYAFNYVFAQAEFGLLCPVSATDTSALLIQNYASEDIKERYLPRMLTQCMDELERGAQFMTEKVGGSDVSGSTLTARKAGSHWELWGDKWFCSCADHEVVLLLARCEGAPDGNRGLSLFLMPRTLEDGTTNRYRIARLKDKLGSRSMATGEVIMEGAVAYLLGEPGRGLRQIMDQTNLCRLSHGFRAAGMMRRCVNEALQVAHNRRAFGKLLIEQPLAQRQLLKMILPVEQAMSVGFATAKALDEGNAKLVRILTPLVKLRACRDNVKVATASMEMRGGNGYIEDWPNARLVRDAHLGILWEGTSSINALDIIKRAVGRERAHFALRDYLLGLLNEFDVPSAMKLELQTLVEMAISAVDATASDPEQEVAIRQVSTQLYNVTSAVLLATEGVRLAKEADDARRLLLARLVIDHRIHRQSPLKRVNAPQERAQFDCLFARKSPTLMNVTAALS